jgi:hypothetical protein
LHAVGEVHETPLKEPPVLPEGNGTDLMVHVLPFQASARGLALLE